MCDSLHYLDIVVYMQITGSVLYILAYGDYALPEDSQGDMRLTCGCILDMYAVERTTSRFPNVDLNMFVNQMTRWRAFHLSAAKVHKSVTQSHSSNLFGASMRTRRSLTVITLTCC